MSVLSPPSREGGAVQSSFIVPSVEQGQWVRFRSKQQKIQTWVPARVVSLNPGDGSMDLRYYAEGNPGRAPRGSIYHSDDPRRNQYPERAAFGEWDVYERDKQLDSKLAALDEAIRQVRGATSRVREQVGKLKGKPSAGND